VPDIIMEQTTLLAKGEKRDNSPLLREANLPRHLEHKGERGKERKDSGQTPAAPGPGQTPPPQGAEAEVKEGELGSDPQLDHSLELLKSWQVFKTFVARREG
jgi:hypothetical protein